MDQLVLAQMGGAQGPSPLGPFVIMGVIFAIFYLLVMRPQQKKEQDKASLRANLKKNDEVVTVSGLYGRIVDLKGQVIWLEVAPNVRVKMERRAVEFMAAKSGKEE